MTARRAVLVLAAGALCTAFAGCGAIARSVDIPRAPGPFDTRAPSAGTVTGVLTRPDGAGPFGAVILLHGCSGLPPSHNRLAELAQWHRARGWVAIVLDSFTPRGVRSVCGSGAVTLIERAGDAYAAMRYLAGLPFVRRDRIVIQGLSHGGSTALLALDDTLFGTETQRFAAAIAYYPACTGTHTLYAPAIVLIGELDDWTPAAPCRAYAEQTRTDPHPVELTVYPGAYHTFDFVAPRRVNEYGKVLEHSPSATADAERRVDAFLRRLSGREVEGR